MLVTNEKDIFNPNVVSFEERQKQLEDEEKKEQERREREKGSPFSRWTQFNNEHTKEMMWLAIKHPKAHAILYFLIDQMDAYNAVMCSYKVLEEVLNVGHATIARNLKILKESGFIAILKSGTSNVFTINDKIYWKSWGNNRKYSKFPANVVLALSEQEEEYRITFEDLKTTKHKEVMKNENDIADSERDWSV
jgi:Fe2+ or Zn2+ uptake regulation protein